MQWSSLDGIHTLDGKAIISTLIKIPPPTSIADTNGGDTLIEGEIPIHNTSTERRLNFDSF